MALIDLQCQLLCENSAIFHWQFYEQDDITGQTNLSEGKCCVPKAQNLSKQIPNQDMLLFGCVS